MSKPKKLRSYRPRHDGIWLNGSVGREFLVQAEMAKNIVARISLDRVRRHLGLSLDAKAPEHQRDETEMQRLLDFCVPVKREIKALKHSSKYADFWAELKANTPFGPNVYRGRFLDAFVLHLYFSQTGEKGLMVQGEFIPAGLCFDALALTLRFLPRRASRARPSVHSAKQLSVLATTFGIEWSARLNGGNASVVMDASYVAKQMQHAAKEVRKANRSSRDREVSDYLLERAECSISTSVDAQRARTPKLVLKHLTASDLEAAQRQWPIKLSLSSAEGKGYDKLVKLLRARLGRKARKAPIPS